MGCKMLVSHAIYKNVLILFNALQIDMHHHAQVFQGDSQMPVKMVTLNTHQWGDFGR